MNIISYNVNGIRAAIKKGFMDWLAHANPDMICLQEIKATKEQILDAIKILEQMGYGYHYWFSAQKKGYSGVAILCKEKPQKITYGTGIEYMDFEGRNLRVDFEKFSVMSLYMPSGTNQDRLAFKLQYMADFQKYINELKVHIPNLIICGDYNICHKAIDIHNPAGNKNTSGFLPVEREWLSRFIASGFVDSFRFLNPSPHRYTWWSYRANARNNNKGWRIDYHMASIPLQKHIQKSYILPDAKHSDHCPIGIVLDI